MDVLVSGSHIRKISVVTGSILFMCCTPQLVLAQREATTTTTRTSTPLLVVRRSGDAESLLRTAVASTSPTLTREQLREYLAPLGFAPTTAAETWRVTPAAPVAAGGRVNLVFFLAEKVSPSDHYASMLGNNIAVSIAGSTVTANVVLRYQAAAAGEKTHIECNVGPTGKPMRLITPDGEKPSASGSLTAVYVAPDRNWASFTIRSESIGGWTFHSCTVTPLQ